MTKDELRTDIDNWLADNETFVSNNYSRTELLMLMYEYGKHLLQQCSVMRSVCWHCKEPIEYLSNGKPSYRCKCGAVEPANDA